MEALVKKLLGQSPSGRRYVVLGDQSETIITGLQNGWNKAGIDLSDTGFFNGIPTQDGHQLWNRDVRFIANESERGSTAGLYALGVR